MNISSIKLSRYSFNHMQRLMGKYALTIELRKAYGDVMLLFKTSGATIDGVVKYERHAFLRKPKSWTPGELILISKNHRDLQTNEKQIQYTSILENIRHLNPGEADQYWRGNENRWQWLIECNQTARVAQPFNLIDVLGERKRAHYGYAQQFAYVKQDDEELILSYLNRVGTVSS